MLNRCNKYLAVSAQRMRFAPSELRAAPGVSMDYRVKPGNDEFRRPRATDSPPIFIPRESRRIP
jgi:hypothetical protein